MHRPGFNALCAQVLAAVFALSACGGRLAPEDRKATDIPGASEPAVGASSSSSPGSLVAQVYLPAGVSVTTVSYTVSGPAGLQRMSTLSFPPSQVVDVLISDLPPSEGDTLSVSMTATDGTSCAGVCSFAIVSGSQSTATLFASCNQSLPPSAGPAASSSPATMPPAASSPATMAPAASSPPQPPQHGTIVVSVEITSGVSITTVDTELTGPNGLDVRDSLDTHGGSFRFNYENVPVAMGDMITVHATTADGSEECTAQSTLDVIANQSTETTLFLRCQAAPVGGDR
jgi:hypothetical protein